MSNVIDLNSRRKQAEHKRKEARSNALKERFENALPSEEQDPKKKLLGLFKRKDKDKKKPRKPTPSGDGW
ncbi:MAG: hypothetical protein OIF57_01755 [Marinobacterium sp.]|nr:hypothetical protein [Marinobacterium sp.]